MNAVQFLHKCIISVACSWRGISTTNYFSGFSTFQSIIWKVRTGHIKEQLLIKALKCSRFLVKVKCANRFAEDVWTKPLLRLDWLSCVWLDFVGVCPNRSVLCLAGSELNVWIFDGWEANEDTSCCHLHISQVVNLLFFLNRHKC